MPSKTPWSDMDETQSAFSQACKIKAYWAARGIDVDVKITTSHEPLVTHSGHYIKGGPVQTVRTGTVRGLPIALLWRGEAR